MYSQQQMEVIIQPVQSVILGFYLVNTTHIKYSNLPRITTHFVSTFDDGEYSLV